MSEDECSSVLQLLRILQRFSGVRPYNISEPEEPSMALNIRGIIPPTVTPMLPNEDVDYPTLRKLIDHQIACGIHGIFNMCIP